MTRSLALFGSFVLLFPSVLLAGPYAPAAGQEGSTAIFCNDPRISEWATGISVTRGPVKIDDLAQGYASWGSPTDALGPATSSTAKVVSLGDGGLATLTFAHPITNGPGADFAVFENSLNDTYLELGFVEVSSDGAHFFRFPSVSLSQTDTQIDGYSVLPDPTDLYNLAGKYRGGYGTPFDLGELAGTPGLDIDAVTHVRIIDVVGCLQDGYCTYDSQGHKINDPWSTEWSSGGFDLNGVGAINVVPEPGSLALLASGLFAAFLVYCGRWKSRLN